jgi:hypothetical protein
VGIDEFVTNSYVDNCVSNFPKFHPPKLDPNVFGHFFYPYVSLNLDDFDICVASHSSQYVVDPSQDSMYFIPTFDVICVGPSSFAYVVECNHETICFVPMFNVLCPSTFVVFITSYFHFAPSCDVMFFGFEIGEGIDPESPRLRSLF